MSIRATNTDGLLGGNSREAYFDLWNTEARDAWSGIEGVSREQFNLLLEGELGEESGKALFIVSRHGRQADQVCYGASVMWLIRLASEFPWGGE